MEVTAIITTHNRAHLLQEAVDSIFAQTRRPDEVIIIDDGSTDDTESFLKPYASQIRYVWQPQKGVSFSRNQGINLARFEWICFLDSDDQWRPQKLARQLQELQGQPDFLICYTDEEWRRDGQWLNQGKRHRKYSGWIYPHCLPLCIISPSSVLLHRSVFADIGLFDESLPAGEDYDLWLRLTAKHPVLFLPERLIIKRAGDWPSLSQQPGLDRYRILALEKMLHNNELNETDRLATGKMLRQKCTVYAQGCRKHHRSDEADWAESLIYRYLDLDGRIAE